MDTQLRAEGPRAGLRNMDVGGYGPTAWRTSIGSIAEQAVTTETGDADVKATTKTVAVTNDSG